MVVFDQNYRNADQAEVVELYYITPQPTIDEKYLYPADHMPIDSFMTENDGKTVPSPRRPHGSPPRSPSPSSLTGCTTWATTRWPSI